MLERLEGAWHWAVLCATGARCFVCGSRYRWHAPWQWWQCNRTPLRIKYFGQENEQVA
jgi:hypothetical protein